MTQKQAIQLFEERKVRTVWDDQTEEWYFSIVDVVGVLTDSVNPTDYIKKMKKRDPELSKGWGQIVTPLSVQTAGGRQRVNCATTQGMFRIIQSIPSPKAEPFKQCDRSFLVPGIECGKRKAELLRYKCICEG